MTLQRPAAGGTPLPFPARRSGTYMENPMNPEIEDMDGMLTMMERYGGSFVRYLACAWRCADPQNSARLATAFPEYVRDYSTLAKGARERGELQ